MLWYMKKGNRSNEFHLAAPAARHPAVPGSRRPAPTPYRQTKQMAISISQEAFDSMVRENMEDLGMDPDEALADAVEALTLQGADLSGIVKRVPGEATAAEVSPVVRVLDELKASLSASGGSEQDLDGLVSLLDELRNLCCSGEGSENAAIAVRNGVVEALVALCASARVEQERLLASALKSLSSVLRDVASTEKFRRSEGPRIVMDLLQGGSENSDLLDAGFSVVAAGSAGNEVVKESFMDLKVDELILRVMKDKSKSNVQSLYDAIRVLLKPDDNRVVASQMNLARYMDTPGDLLKSGLQKFLSMHFVSKSLLPVCHLLVLL
ncbi:ARM repeat superfamily protein [Zea mays]|uniref:ARM repeat superfamily protein n=1 Tax=Zea mays TaxID=4577 RepID=A0A1D6HL33_MAIZE|nr:ARM repeat superfamily protein [Zea mays]